jgi:hypothetical protein
VGQTGTKQYEQQKGENTSISHFMIFKKFSGYFPAKRPFQLVISKFQTKSATFYILYKISQP